MTKLISRRLVLSAGSLMVTGTAFTPMAWAQAAGSGAGPVIGQSAPAFTGTDINGKSIRLADLAGKLVVLEWTNHGCPFVRKHYDSRNMQRLQADATAQGVVWLSLISSAPGEQGHVSPADGKARMEAEKWAASALLLDPAGTIGRAYGAKTTPHMYIIGKDGTLLYNGAIDDRPTAEVQDIEGARNHVREALTEILAGKPVSVSSTRPYGCGVKYPRTAA